MRRREIHLTLAAAAVSLLLAGPVAADDPGWTVRARAAWVDPGFSWSAVNDDETRVSATSDSEIGLGLDLEYRVSRRFGLELGVVWAEPDLVLRAEAPTGESVEVSDGTRFMPISAGVAIHLTPDGPVDLYVAPFAAWVMYSDPSFAVADIEPLSVSIDDDFGWGGTLGVDIPLGDRLTLNAMVRYYDTDIEVTEDGEDGGTETFAFDPWVYGVGIGYRF